MSLKHLFPLSLYHSNIILPINDKNKIVEYILKHKSQEGYKRYKEETFSWTGDQEGQADLHKLQIFEFLFKEIKKKIYDYLDLLFIDYSQFDIYFQRSWATVSNTKEFIGRHNHAQSHLSFAYYLQKNVGDSKIIFWDNYKHNEFIPELFNSPTIKSKNIIKKKDMTNSYHATINPQEGDLLIFPSKTFHSTEKNSENKNRISISADISFLAKDENFLEHLTPPFSKWRKF